MLFNLTSDRSQEATGVMSLYGYGYPGRYFPSMLLKVSLLVFMMNGYSLLLQLLEASTFFLFYQSEETGRLGPY